MPPTILVVDDLEANRILMQMVLEKEHFNIMLASNGSEALKIAHDQPPDLLITDIMMPVMDGYTLCDEWKKDKRLSGIPLIFCSGTFTAPDDKKLATAMGGAHFLQKPLRPSNILKIVSEVLKDPKGDAKYPLEDKEQVYELRSGVLTRKLEKKAKELDSVLKQIHHIEKGRRFLLVDDNPEYLDTLGDILSSIDMEYDFAENGEQAIDALNERSYDLVITDMNMPKMHGMELLEYIRNHFSGTNVVVMTGYSKEFSYIDVIKAGAVDFMEKPFTKDEFIAKIHRILRERQLIKEYQKEILERKKIEEEKSNLEEKMRAELTRELQARTSVLAKTQVQLFQTSKLAILGEMAAGVAHEINQPLGGLALVAKTFKKLLARGTLTMDQIGSGVTDIEDSVARMTKIVKHIRTFARQDEMEKILVDIPATINSALSLLGEQMRQHSINVILQLDDSLPKIHGEPNQLEQVWINLLTNARDALDEREKGQAERPGSEYRKRITISSITRPEATPDFVEIQVMDNGEGMSEQQKNKIFEPFFTSKQVGKGTGLGMSISLGIIESHGGKIEVESNHGEGTSIKVLLPVDGNVET